MFSFVSFLIALFAVLPFNGLTQVDLPKSDNLSPIVADFKIPTILTPSITPFAEKNNPPGQVISNIAKGDHGGGISEQVHVVISENKTDNSPTVSPTPAPVVTDYPKQNPSEVDNKPTIEPKGCPPCGGGNGKFECPMVMCIY